MRVEGKHKPYMNNKFSLRKPYLDSTIMREHNMLLIA